MAVYPINPPPLTPATENISLLRKQGIAQSPFTGSAQVVNNFAQWQVQISFPPVARGSSAEKSMLAWIDSLSGSQGSFLYYPRDYGKASITGKSLAATGFAESNSIVVMGWSGSSTIGLEAGDLFSIGNSLFRITSVPTNAASGQVTISFEPPLRQQIAGGSTVNFATPRVEVRLVGGDDAPGYSKDAESTYLSAISAVQVL